MSLALSNEERRRRKAKVWWLLATAVALGWLAYAALVEPRRLEVTTIRAHLPGLGPGLDGARILHLTDLHLLKIGWSERVILALAERIRPQIVAVTGDFCSRWGIDEGVRLLESLRAPLGVFFVPGNNDDRTLDVLRAKARWVKFLVNECEVVEHGESLLAVVGVDDPHTGRDDLEAALRGAPEGAPVLLLAHSPDVALRAGFERVGLCLCGHTHGGQICPLPRRPLYTHTRGRVPPSGLHKVRGAFLYVSRGVGTSILPLRFLCPPEVAVVELRDAKGGEVYVEVVSRARARRWLGKEA